MTTPIVDAVPNDFGRYINTIMNVRTKVGRTLPKTVQEIFYEIQERSNILMQSPKILMALEICYDWFLNEIEKSCQ